MTAFSHWIPRWLSIHLKTNTYFPSMVMIWIVVEGGAFSTYYVQLQDRFENFRDKYATPLNSKTQNRRLSIPGSALVDSNVKKYGTQYRKSINHLHYRQKYFIHIKSGQIQIKVNLSNSTSWNTGIYHLSIWNLWVMRLGDRKWICSLYWRPACTFKKEFEHYEKSKLNEIKGVAKCNKYSVNIWHIV